MPADRQPRPRPPSIMEDLPSIGDRMREIWRQEERKPADLFEPREPKPYSYLVVSRGGREAPWEATDSEIEAAKRLVGFSVGRWTGITITG